MNTRFTPRDACPCARASLAAVGPMPHTADCPACARTRSDAARVRAALCRAIDAEPVAASLRAAVMTRIRTAAALE